LQLPSNCCFFWRFSLQSHRYMMSDIDLHPFLGTDAVSGDVIVAGHSTPLLLK
jgi:hypothetical protein